MTSVIYFVIVRTTRKPTVGVDDPPKIAGRYTATPNGDKTCRYADAVEKDKVTNEITKIHQVGKVNKNGLPVTRESKAIEDIMKNIEEELVICNICRGRG